MALAAFGTDAYHRTARDGCLRAARRRRLRAHHQRDGDGLVHRDRMLAFCPKRERGSATSRRTSTTSPGPTRRSPRRSSCTRPRSCRSAPARRRLAMAGGVALNCVANTEILQPDRLRRALHHARTPVTAASPPAARSTATRSCSDGAERHPLTHDYLGRPNTDDEIVKALENADGIEHHRSDDIAAECAALVADGAIIGWVQGGGEFGPRALGHRSLIADPRSIATKQRLDEEVKRREWFRPYAPSALAEHADEYFEMLGAQPLHAARGQHPRRGARQGAGHRPRRRLAPACRPSSATSSRSTTGSSRKFHELTGIPLVVDTSFNGYGEPMVETTEDALAAMHQMGLDALAVGDHLIKRCSRSVDDRAEVERVTRGGEEPRLDRVAHALHRLRGVGAVDEHLVEEHGVARLVAGRDPGRVADHVVDLVGEHHEGAAHRVDRGLAARAPRRGWASRRRRR